MSIFLAALLAATMPSAPMTSEANDPVSIVDQAAQDRGDPSEVLVLGTAHLSSLPENFDTARFDPLLERLESWQPDAVAIENLDGPQCDFLRAYAHAHTETADRFCPDPAPAREALGMEAPEADRELGKILAEEAAERPPELRRRLAVLFLAVGEPDSALVQWLRLPATERYAEDALTAELAAMLERRETRLNESSLIGAHLAARLGHERVYPVDDHTGDIAAHPIDPEVYGREMRTIWDNEAAAEGRAAHERLQEALVEGSMSVIDWYREMNSDRMAELAMRGDFGAAAAAKSPGNTGRKYLAYWETRNLRMVANLRVVAGGGKRVLAIVGASHVPHYERYLRMLSDVAPVRAEAVLD
ncbi:MAG: DUF5694 domain-containing protein [Qipengyuania sp.]